jgi:[protein-PII] uridylyltransferase
LQTLFWIGKYVNRIDNVAGLVDAGLLTAQELKQFQKAESFLWAVRSHLHDITKREEDRLTFDLQLEVAERMNFTARSGRSGVERFMRYYFLMAKVVGDLTGVFLAHLDDQWAVRGRRFMPTLFRRRASSMALCWNAGVSRFPATISFRAIRCACLRFSRWRISMSWKFIPAR